MIERFYAKSLLSFEHVELEFDPALVVFSGPSGAGKSVLMGAILAGFGLWDAMAQISEMEISLPDDIESELYELENPCTIKLIKKNSLRCYIDAQSISRKELKNLLSTYVHYLSVRDKGGFESQTLISLMDTALSKSNEDFAALLRDYNEHYKRYEEASSKLEEIKASEKEINDKIEFAKYEIEKIRSIDPKEGEFEELMTIKRQLSRIEKIKEAARRAEMIFEAEGAIEELFGLLEKDSSYLSDALNQLRSDMEDSNRLIEELGEIDVESVLNRLEELNGLIRRYGSISEALEYLAAKEEELAGYTHIEEDKSALELEISSHLEWLESAANEISRSREAYASTLANRMSRYLERLKLPNVIFVFERADLGWSGIDKVDMELEGSKTATLSGGEHNRLRLALMASTLVEESKRHEVVILDEIDANVSGDESIAIAEMISELSSVYQVFAISHQPHLAAKASQHILVSKNGDTSRAKVLDEEGRVQEIARIIGGEMADDEAVAFARKILDN